MAETSYFKPPEIKGLDAVVQVIEVEFDVEV